MQTLSERLTYRNNLIFRTNASRIIQWTQHGQLLMSMMSRDANTNFVRSVSVGELEKKIHQIVRRLIWRQSEV